MTSRASTRARLAILWVLCGSLLGCGEDDCDARCQNEVDVCMVTLIRLREANDFDRERHLVSGPEHERRDNALFRGFNACEGQAVARSIKRRQVRQATR